MALPKDHLAKFHKMTDVKEMWETIKSRFGGNDESKKMHKYILKQQFEGFSVSNSEWLHKGYDRTKPGVDSLSFNDLYNNLRVFEFDVKGSTASSSSTQNMAFVYKNTSSTNEVSTTYGASTSSGHNLQREGSSSYTDELMYSFFANQSSGPQLDHDDLEQLDEFDLEEMDLKWQVAMISIRLKKFYKKTGRKLQSKGNQDSMRKDVGYTGYKAKDNGRRPGKQEEPKALVTLDGDGVDWTNHSKDEQENYALMAYSNSGSDTEREQLGDASIEIQDYTQALKKMSARDKVGLRYGNQMHKGILSYENEVFERVFDRIYIPSSNFASCESNPSVETNEFVPKLVANEPKAVSDPKVWSDAPIIEEYE
ncbi:hypothetical protein Tco_1390455 [Tanacetum coccineum]